VTQTSPTSPDSNKVSNSDNDIHVSQVTIMWTPNFVTYKNDIL
jgi:hypothetical protein